MKIKSFVLKRTEDVSGVSGTGIVAEGVQFSNGKCALNWLTNHTSVAIYDDIETLAAIHEHGGKTVIAWNEGPEPETPKRLFAWLSSSGKIYLLPYGKKPDPDSEELPWLNALMNQAPKCEVCGGKGWVKYYMLVDKGDYSETEQICVPCDACQGSGKAK